MIYEEVFDFDTYPVFEIDPPNFHAFFDTPCTPSTPSFSISRRYGKIADKIYKSLIDNKCIAKVDNSSFKSNFFQLLYNLYSKIIYSSQRVPIQSNIDNLNKFISSLPTIKKINKMIAKIEKFDFINEGDNNRRRGFIKRVIKKTALIRIVLLIYEHYYMCNDSPFFEQYTEIINCNLTFFHTIPNEIVSKINEELKLKTNFFSKCKFISLLYHIDIKFQQFPSKEKYLSYYKEKKQTIQNLTKCLDKSMFIH